MSNGRQRFEAGREQKCVTVNDKRQREEACHTTFQHEHLVSHLFLRVEGMEVVIVGELGSAAHVLERKKTDSVHPID